MPTQDDAFLRITKDDERAARVLSLAVKFFGSSRPVPSSVIAADLYPGLDELAFNRQYLRDRELLATFGVIVERAPDHGGESRWQVNETASFVEGTGFAREDTRLLYVLCHDLIYDHSFAYRDELRMALAKIAQIYRGSTITRHDTTSSQEHKLLGLLVSCLSNRRAVTATYTDALGRESRRRLALLGSFGLRDHTYFVASRVERDGTLVPDSMRTYRLDRFNDAHELRGCHYEIPLDFSVSDFEHLPFQIGDTVGTARLALPAEASSELTRVIACSGEVEARDQAPQGQRVWSVGYSDLQSAASWAIGSDIVPLAPPELVERYRDTLAETAAHDPHDPTIGASTCIVASLGTDGTGGPGTLAPARRTRKHAGRTGSINRARQLVTLASSLTREGREITARDIAHNLGVDDGEARHLIALLSMSGSEDSIDFLPVELGDDDDLYEKVSLMEGASLDVRRVRLTRTETLALQAALTELGVGTDDPLSRTLIEAYAAPSFSLEDIKRSLERLPTNTDGPTMRCCSKAISAGNGLAFSYCPVSGGAMSKRLVQPQRVWRNDDNWYLDAYDLGRQDQRVFRLDHMSELREVPLDEQPVREMGQRPEMDAPMVLLRFADPRYLELFHWNRLEVLGRDEQGIVCRLPIFGGTWLARHVVACGGTVTTDSEPLATQIRELSRGLAKD